MTDWGLLGKGAKRSMITLRGGGGNLLPPEFIYKKAFKIDNPNIKL